MDARRLQAITVSPEQVVLKRGVHELLVSGADAAPIVDTLLAALRRAADVDEVLLYTPDQHRAAIEQLIRSLRARRLIDDAPPPAPDVRDAAQWAFFGALDADPVAAQATLRDATVTVLGLNRTSLVLVRSLAALGVGTVRTVTDPELDDPEVAAGWTAAVGRPARTRVLARAGAGAWPGPAQLLVAAGPVPALLRANRRAVDAGVPFLPVRLTGHLGPLVVPRETACLRCESTETTSPAASPAPAGVCGRIAAMEVLKYLTRCAPSGLVGRVAKVDAHTGALSVRRVFKKPRCPDCGEVARHRVPAVLTGPQIPNR